MREPLFSPLWHRISDRCPHLRGDLRIHRQEMRGQAWYVLADPAGGRPHRINHEAWRLAGRCDGKHTAQEIWDSLLDELRDDAPTQDEVLRTLSRLEESGLVSYDIAPSAATLQKRQDAQARRGFMNPFALRIPLGDPAPMLRRLDGLAQRLFSQWMLLAWIAVVLVAIAAAGANWDSLRAQASSGLTAPRYLALALILFPIVKSLHELAHALAVRRWGGAVHEAGFSLIVLVPAPYVDASAAGTFPARYQRVTVGAAGVMVELGIAAAALAVWVNAAPGLVQDIAFVALFICSVSALLFNANPLLPFDGYYVLCDALDLPNLGSRSRAWWGMRLRMVAGAGEFRAGRGETKWLAAYAPLSLACRIVLSYWMVLWIGAHSSLLGALAALVSAWFIVARPAWAGYVRLRGAHAPARRRALAAGAGTAAIAAIALFAIPLPYHTVASAVVWPPEQARVRAGTGGFVTAVLAKDGQQVAAGDLLLTLDDPELFVLRARLRSEQERLQAASYSGLLDDPGKAQNAAQELVRLAADLQRADQRIADLQIRAQAAGTMALPAEADLPGTWVRQGATLGYILAGMDISVRAAVPEYDASLIRSRTRRAEVMLSESGARAVEAQVVRDTPAATYELPSLALGEHGGGPFATDPADKQGLRSNVPVVLVDLKLPATALARVGGRAWVRFDHDAEPVAHRWLRRLQQVFLRHFNPSA